MDNLARYFLFPRASVVKMLTPSKPSSRLRTIFSSYANPSKPSPAKSSKKLWRKFDGETQRAIVQRTTPLMMNLTGLEDD